MHIKKKIGFNVDGWAQNVDTTAFAYYGSNPHTKEAIVAFKGKDTRYIHRKICIYN